MKSVKCVKCGNDVEINISKAVDMNGEEFICTKCGFVFRYVDE